MLPYPSALGSLVLAPDTACTGQPPAQEVNKRATMMDSHTDILYINHHCIMMIEKRIVFCILDEDHNLILDLTNR